MKVIKRDGTVADFDISKIKKQIEFACEGLDVNPLELESKISISIKNKIKTSEIQELLILTANTLISEQETDWSIVSGRLATFNLHREVFKNTGFEHKDFKEFLNYAKNNNYYRKDIDNNFTEQEKDILIKLLHENKDRNMNIAQVLSLKSKYLITNNKGYIEYPQFSDLASSMLLASVEKDRVQWTKNYFNEIKEERLSLATPFKANLRLENGNTGSCFIIPIGDSLGQIAKGWSDIAIISKEGGGVGVYLGYIRPSNTRTKSIKKSNNVTRWTKIINDIAVAVNQRGIRPGAVTPAVDWWHLDIEEFIKMKTETGGDLRLKCFDLFPQVVVDKYFVEAVMNDKEVYLFNQYELKEKFGIDIITLTDEALYDAQLKVFELAEAKKLKKVHKIKAKALWKEIMSVWVETGDFYITKKEGLNKSNYLKDLYVANSANLCVSGDTRIDVTIGENLLNISIEELEAYFNDPKYREKIKVLSKNIETGELEFKKVTDWFLTNPEAEVFEIESEGKKLICTGDHKIFTKNRGYVKASELKEDDVLDFL